MSYFSFIIRAAFDDFRRSKMRTFLTSLGILIGVAAVILLLAFGLGLRKYISDQFESLGTNLIYVMPGKFSSSGPAGMIGGIKFDFKDVNKLERIKILELVAPVYARSGVTVKAGAEDTDGEIIASTADINIILNLETTAGRLLNKTDVEKRTKVVFLGAQVSKDLFLSDEDAVGQTINIAEQNFKVVGVAKSKGGGGFGGSGLDNHIYMTYTAAYSFNPDKKFYAIYAKTADTESIEIAKEEIKEVLLKRYDEDEFSVVEQKEILNTVESIFGVINLILVAIGAISLIVGGIGIMNIMYVSVTERIKEIGIRRAVGAEKRDILFHFLAESVILSLIGGVLALLISYLIIFFVQKFFPAYIDFPTIAIALGVSSAIGIFFGVFPAKKAADLSPIDAIRYE